jgi:hypothetical protein
MGLVAIGFSGPILFAEGLLKAKTEHCKTFGSNGQCHEISLTVNRI